MTGFSDNIYLKDMAGEAHQSYTEMQTRLSQIDNRIQAQSKGRTRGGLGGAFVGTFFWLAVYVVLAHYAKDRIAWTYEYSEYAPLLLLVPFACCVLLCVVMLIDAGKNAKYFGAILKYQTGVHQLTHRIDSGKKDMKSETKSFFDSSKRGWDVPLNAGAPIPEEALRIDRGLSAMESFHNGATHKAKNVLYFLVAILNTVAGAFALGLIVVSLVDNTGFGKGSVPIFIIALALACIIEIVLARVVWGKTDCSVKNATLIMTIIGPLLFLALAALIVLIVVIAAAVLKVIMTIIAVIVVVACLLCCTSGG